MAKKKLENLRARAPTSARIFFSGIFHNTGERGGQIAGFTRLQRHSYVLCGGGERISAVGPFFHHCFQSSMFSFVGGAWAVTGRVLTIAANAAKTNFKYRFASLS